jgi:D-alanyl-lipoteichoic acid acyltransferase DltB (MBOAT superfamily)
MAFNSFEFILFFVACYIIYWLMISKQIKIQNLFLLLAGYVFYARTNWHFLFYLIAFSAANFFIGMYMEQTNNSRTKQWLYYTALLLGAGGLAFFKYFNFFIDSFKDAFHLIGIGLNIHTLNIIIPLGISFFTFRTLSYIIDIQREEIKATKDWVIFFTYVSFFPSILSGPIDRAKTLIPQLEKKRSFSVNETIDGLSQILWGLFKKAVIADNCASYTNEIFDHHQTYQASTLVLGAFFYAIQLYADFSGYSDMAIGIARLLGFNITKNFDFPFFAENIASFWRKWHMSLTTWLTDYIFTPLNFTFRRLGKKGLFFAILINYTLCGIWHGANRTYILYGFLHGCYFIPLIIKGTVGKKQNMNNNSLFSSFIRFMNRMGTFILVMLTFVLFRADTIQQAFSFYARLFNTSVFSIPTIENSNLPLLTPVLFITAMLLIEWMQRTKEHALQFNRSGGLKSYSIALLYSLIIWSVILWGYSGNKTFMYVKF